MGADNEDSGHGDPKSSGTIESFLLLEGVACTTKALTLRRASQLFNGKWSGGAPFI